MNSGTTVTSTGGTVIQNYYTYVPAYGPIPERELAIQQGARNIELSTFVRPFKK